MKKFFAACISVFACLFIYGFSFAETVSISGAVTNFSSSSNLALDDITIEVTGTMNFQVKTGKNGKYKISGLEKGGTYTLTVSKPGYDFVPVTKLFENLGKNETNQNFSVESVKFSISGKVVFGGKPLKGVAVTINDDPTKYYTDANGDYIIDIAETKGPYEVKVISDEYYFEPFTINSLKESIVHDFRKDIAISGRVVSLGEGVPGLEVDINGSKYITDENGYYKVESAVANTDYVIKIADNNFFSSPKSIPIKKITKSREHLDFDVTGQFSGKVVYNGKPFK
ncbi:MAG: carboxypeptidase regulatory-like domain-containing protein, partial [Elusimicrobia bacterium]|nr:carboxypeptidase regulatory-like domain-containing protein [Elusimicrobiota bacterium]